MDKSKLFFVSLLCLIVAFTAISCGKKVPLTEDQKVYAGKWVAADSTFVHIYLNGGGDLKTSNSNVTGGSVTIAADSITIGLGPIKKTMAISEKPKETDGKWSMKLDGIEYVKQ